jgi:hypothetical protein
MKIGLDGLRWVLGADQLSESEIRAFEQKMNFTAIYQAQTGMVEDMDYMKTVIYKED